MHCFVRTLPLLSVGLALGISQGLRADLVVGSINMAETIDFETSKSDVNVDAFVGTGFTPSPASGQLDSSSWRIVNNDGDLAFGGTATTGAFARGLSNTSVTDGGIWSFDTDNNGTSGDSHALGLQPTTAHSILNPGEIRLRIMNSTGSTVSSWEIDYDVFAFNDAGRSSTFNFSYSTDDVTYTPVGALDFTSTEPADVMPAWTLAARSTLISASVADGDRLYLRWTIAFPGGGNGSEFDQLALDNISVAAVPEPAAVLFGGVVCGVIGLSVGIRRIRATRRLARGTQ
jgi:hypothetical protein